MAATKPRTSSFSRNFSSAHSTQTPELKHGPNGTTFISSGIPDLDKILCGGFPLGSLVLVMEDAEAPHHMLLLRNFMSQGLVHNQPLLYASPSRDPKGFLGTLPSPGTSKDDKSRDNSTEQEKSLRIAWQYKKYFGDSQESANAIVFYFPRLYPDFHLQGWDGRSVLVQYPDTNSFAWLDLALDICSKMHLEIYSHPHSKYEFCNDFDVRRPFDRHFFSGKHVDCISIFDSSSLSTLRDRCATFLSQVSRKHGNISSAGRIAIQSLCAPQYYHSNMEWEILSFISSLKSMLRSSNAVAVVTFPPSLLLPSFSKRWQHMADTLLSVRAIPDEDKGLAKLLTGYKDMVGFLNVHKVAQINTQVPKILEATTFSIKLQNRRFIVLECLNQAPVDGSSGSSYGSTGSCSGSSKTGSLDF